VVGCHELCVDFRTTNNIQFTPICNSKWQATSLPLPYSGSAAHNYWECANVWAGYAECVASMYDRDNDICSTYGAASGFFDVSKVFLEFAQYESATLASRAPYPYRLLGQDKVVSCLNQAPHSVCGATACVFSSGQADNSAGTTFRKCTSVPLPSMAATSTATALQQHRPCHLVSQLKINVHFLVLI
jgi:hypothetical protein